MTSITLQEAQFKLAELIQQLAPGEEFLITDDGQPIAQVKKAMQAAEPSKAGCYQKPEFWMAPDFDAPLEDFKEYME